MFNNLFKIKTYGDSLITPNNYTLIPVVKIESVPLKYTSDINDINNLDKIMAFDLAEAVPPYTGQLNMIKVSSFCGPGGKLFGLETFKSELKQDSNLTNELNIKVYDGNSIESIITNLFGTRENPKYNIIPGALTPAAYKDVYALGPNYIFAGMALGIPANRDKNAILIMENCQVLKNEKEVKNCKINLVDSILEIGKNQNVKYKSVILISKYKQIPKNELGCGLIMGFYTKIPLITKIKFYFENNLK